MTKGVKEIGVIEAKNENALEEASEIFSLLKQARLWSSEDKPESIIGSALIYASFSEFLAYSLLNTVISNLNAYSTLRNGKTLLNLKIFNNKYRTNLSTIRSRLDMLDFPKKAEVITLLGKLNIIRDEIFHNLISKYRTADKFKPCVEKLKGYSEDLINLWADICSILDKDVEELLGKQLVENKTLSLKTTSRAKGERSRQS